MSEQSSCDVFVIFGITGDLAKVMTFRSLYRLEQRKLLDCPIIGVAADDWSVDQLVDRARTSIIATGEQLDEATFARLAGRFSYVAGDFGDDATYGRVGDAIKGFQNPVFYLEIPPFLFGDRREGPLDRRPHRTRSRGGREAVRPRPRVGAGLGEGAAPVHRRVAAPAHRPLPREDGTRRDPLPALRQHHAGAGVEPELRRVGADHDGGGLRRRGPRSLLRSRRRAARRGREPSHAGRRGHRDGSARRR